MKNFMTVLVGIFLLAQNIFASDKVDVLNSYSTNWLRCEITWEHENGAIVSKVYSDIGAVRKAYKQFWTNCRKQNLDVPELTDDNIVKDSKNSFRITPSFTKEHYSAMTKWNERKELKNSNAQNNPALNAKLTSFEQSMNKFAKMNGDAGNELEKLFKQQFPASNLFRGSRHQIFPVTENSNFLLRTEPYNKSDDQPYIYEAVLSLEQIEKITQLIESKTASAKNE